MRAYLQTHNDTRYGTYLVFPLVKNEVNDSAFEWEEINEEFSYHGEMYDVVSINNTQDSIRICALKDDRENKLDEQMETIRHSPKGTHANPVLSLIKFFSAFDRVNTGIVFLTHTIPVHYAVNPNPVYLSYSTEIHSPPPRGC